MTSDVEPDAAFAAYSLLIQNYLDAMGVSILFYDHLFVTLGDEITHIWHRPKAASAWWFFLNRYVALFGNIAVFAMSLSPLTPEGCDQYNDFRQALLVINQAFVSILLTLRTYAFWARSRRILALMICAAAALLGVAIWSLTDQDDPPENRFPGCQINISNATGIHLATTWECLFIYDTFIFTLTLVRTHKTIPRERRSLSLSANSMHIAVLIFRDGAIYYAVMALANLSNILTFYVASPPLKGGLSTFASSISVTLMSRLILNLHENNRAGIFSDSSTTTTMLFTSVAPALSRISPPPTSDHDVPDIEMHPLPQHRSSADSAASHRHPRPYTPP